MLGSRESNRPSRLQCKAGEWEYCLKPHPTTAVSRLGLFDFVPKSSSRATGKAKRTLVKGVKEVFSRLAVGAADNNSLALAVASVKAELGADGQ